MNADAPRVVMARAFRETTLTLIGLFQVYEIDPDLADATAETLGKVFRRHLSATPTPPGEGPRGRLHALADELDRVLDG